MAAVMLLIINVKCKPLCLQLFSTRILKAALFLYSLAVYAWTFKCMGYKTDNSSTTFLSSVTGANMCELLDLLSRHSVEADEFLRQLAIQLPVWKPVAQMLGLTESDIDHIDYDVPSSCPGEKAYQAFLRWMQKEGNHRTTYDVLLLALCRATNISDCKSITNAWWYADQYLNKLAEQST